ncbi:MAG: EAL domain-containing protein [Burkholderiaceae bacterium]
MNGESIAAQARIDPPPSPPFERAIGWVAVVLVALLTLMTTKLLVSSSEHEAVALGHLAAFEEADEAGTTLAQALRTLRTLPHDHETIDLRRSEKPFWLSVPLPRQDFARHPLFDLPSRHLVRYAIWVLDADGQTLVYESGDRRSPANQNVRHSAAGLLIPLHDYLGRDLRIVARLESAGPARLTARLWTDLDYENYVRNFERVGGVLLGSLALLSIFCLVIVIRVQSSMFTVFAGWIVCSLGAAALSTGHLHVWMAGVWPLEAQVFLRRFFLGACALYTTVLFESLFRRELETIGHTRRIVAVRISCVLLTLLAVPMSMAGYLPLLWGVSAIGATVMLWSLATVIRRTGSVSARWFALSWVVNFAGVLAEVGFASGLLPVLPPGINNVGGALVAALLMGAALGEQIRVDRDRRLSAEARSVAVLRSYRDMYRRNATALFRASVDGSLTYWNPAFARLFEGTTAHLVAGEPLAGLLGSDEVAVRIELLGDSQRAIDFEVESRHGPLQARQFSINLTLSSGIVEGAIQDITDRKIAERELIRIAERDHLTDLMNRRALEAHVERQKSALPDGATIAISFFDLDRFKLINDLFGHVAGDDVLKEVANRIRGECVEGMTACRIGGDEFVVVQVVDELQQAIMRARRIVTAICATPYAICGGAKSVTASCSAGVIQADASISFRDTLVSADAACGEAKAKGPGSVVAYGASSLELKDRIEEIRLLTQLKDHLPTESLVLYLQPIVRVQGSERQLCAEALIRMKDVDGTLMHPAQFVQAAERNGVMSIVDRWVLDQAIAWLERVVPHQVDLQWLSVNFSATSLNDERFIDHVMRTLAAHPQATRRLCIEITESVALFDLAHSRRVLEGFIALGARIALDDFGAGYTSFKYLTQLPASIIKIDGEFIRDLGVRPENLAITRTIVALVNDLKLETVAEWVEDLPALLAVAQIGTTYVQGYGVASPMPIAQFEREWREFGFTQNALIRNWLLGRGDASVSPAPQHSRDLETLPR